VFGEAEVDALDLDGKVVGGAGADPVAVSWVG
jgi:hypothetical protein